MNAPVCILPDWTRIVGADRLKLVKQFSDQGYSAKQIAQQFTNCTRNAVIGVWHRYPECKGAKHVRRSESYRKPEDQSPRQPKAPKPPRQKISVIAPNLFVSAKFELPPAPEPQSELPVVIDWPPVSLLDQSSTQCAWIIEDRGPDGFRQCCGAPVHKSGSAWCGEHLRRVAAR